MCYFTIIIRYCCQITTQTLECDYALYTECSHYRPDVGKLLLSIIYEQTPLTPSIGYYLTTQTIDDHLSQIRQDRLKWTTPTQ